MGLYKLCQHRGRERDRGDHGWWGGFRGVRVSLGKWANREIRSKSDASAVLDEMRMFIAALDTGMRRGEMLSLKFADIDLDRGLITLRAETTKSKRTRHVPIATKRLRRVLEWLRRDAVGEPKSGRTLVFSDETGS